jgi:hypothetical protein
MSATDAWQQTGRSPGARRAGDGRPQRYDDRRYDDRRYDDRRYDDQRYDDQRRDEARPARRSQERSAPAQTGGGRLRGVVAVLLVLVATLAGAAADSYLGVGLGTLTLVALVGSTAVATLLVRRRDLVSVLVAPPLVFVVVAVADLAIAPSAHFSLTGMAPLLIKGFPAMGIATAVGLVLAGIRRAAGR